MCAPIRHIGGLVMFPDIDGGSLLSDNMTRHFRFCTCGVMSSGCLMYIFAGPLLNILIKKVVFIFLR